MYLYSSVFFPAYTYTHIIHTRSTCMYTKTSLVPRPIPSFSMFHTEEGLVRKVTRATSHIDRKYTRYRRKVYCVWGTKGQQFCEHSHSQPVKGKALKRTTDYSTIF